MEDKEECVCAERLATLTTPASLFGRWLCPLSLGRACVALVYMYSYIVVLQYRQMATKVMLHARHEHSPLQLQQKEMPSLHLCFAQPITSIQGHVYLILSLPLEISSAAF